MPEQHLEMETLVEKSDVIPGGRATAAPLGDETPPGARWHLLAILLIVGASLLLFYLNFSQRGYLMHADMTWPLSLDRMAYAVFHTWYQYGSMMNVPNIQRILWSVPFLAIAKVLRLSGSQYLLMLFVCTFSLAGISMYALSYSVLDSIKSKGISKVVVIVGAFLAALIYMFNPWSISHLWSFWMYPGYALLPLIFLFAMKVVSRPTLRNTIVLGLLTAVASTSPMDIVWAWFIIITYCLFYLIVSRFKQGSFLRVVKGLALTAGVYLLASAMWVVPYINAILARKPMIATYSSPVSQGMIDALSASNTIPNNLRLVSGWGYPINLVPTGTFPILLSFALPVAAVIALVVLRDRLRTNAAVNYWALMFIISILFATGTTFILRKPYSYAVLGAPGSSAFGWIFRVADRWLALVPVFYAIVIAALLVKLVSSGRAFSGKTTDEKVSLKDEL